jgi:hypothetical protein
LHTLGDDAWRTLFNWNAIVNWAASVLAAHFHLIVSFWTLCRLGTLLVHVSDVSAGFTHQSKTWISAGSPGLSKFSSVAFFVSADVTL